MTLTEIEYGSLASSAILNGNFQYLQDKITDLATIITNETASYSSSVATLNNSVNSLLDLRESLIPTGTVIASLSQSIPNGFLLCDGSEILISDFQNLFDVIGTTFGQNDSTTFCIPNFLDKTVWGANDSKPLGSTIAAGLPNITGSYTNSTNGEATSNGAFYRTGSGKNSSLASTNGFKMNFDASRSNNIYGNSNIVQPPAIAVNFLIKY